MNCSREIHDHGASIADVDVLQVGQYEAHAFVPFTQRAGLVEHGGRVIDGNDFAGQVADLLDDGQRVVAPSEQPRSKQRSRARSCRAAISPVSGTSVS